LYYNGLRQYSLKSIDGGTRNIMIVNYDIRKISQTLQDFYNATGIYMDLFKDDFSAVGKLSHWANNRYCESVLCTAEGKKACLSSDRSLLEKCKKSRRTEMHICHAGLIDAAVPILYDDVIIGYIIFGQIKTSTDFSALENYLSKLGLDTAVMKKYHAELPFYESDKIQSISNIASMLVKHILLENMLRPDFDESIQKAVSYINDHLEKDLSVREIARNINISKSVLYRRFHTCFNCTVSEYINTKRVDRSIELLTKTDLSIEEISQKTGFSSASYYSKIFKKEKGVSPLQYKKTHC